MKIMRPVRFVRSPWESQHVLGRTLVLLRVPPCYRPRSLPHHCQRCKGAPLIIAPSYPRSCSALDERLMTKDVVIGLRGLRGDSACMHVPLGLPPFRENWWFGFVLVFGLYKLFMCLNKKTNCAHLTKWHHFFIWILGKLNDTGCQHFIIGARI